MIVEKVSRTMRVTRGGMIAAGWVEPLEPDGSAANGPGGNGSGGKSRYRAGSLRGRTIRPAAERIGGGGGDGGSGKGGDGKGGDGKGGDGKGGGSKEGCSGEDMSEVGGGGNESSCGGRVGDRYGTEELESLSVGGIACVEVGAYVVVVKSIVREEDGCTYN